MTKLELVQNQTTPFIPPYCPNPGCRWHPPGLVGMRVLHHDSRKIARPPFVTHRYRCVDCRDIFSDSFFSLSYRDRTPPTYETIFDLHHHNYSRREIAEKLGCSLDTVLRRFRELARQGLLIQAHKARDLRIKEPVAFDGIENFAFSQYDPNNINHAIGKRSFFMYDFNFTAFNRKGRMSPRQKIIKNALEATQGRYAKNAIFSSSKRILLRLVRRAEGDLRLHSDNHYAYRDALDEMEEEDQKRIVHLITPAKVGRTFRNRLFPINHSDMLTRKQLATFRRETTCFAKHSIGMIESFAHFMVWKNFMRTIFKKKHKLDAKIHLESPAMRVGLEKKVLTFGEFFAVRLLKTQVPLNKEWSMYVDRVDPTSRRPIRAA